MKNNVLAFIAICLSLPLFSQVNVTVGPYLQSPTPNSIKIKWRTDSASTSKVMFGTDMMNLSQTATDTAVTAWHTVLVSGLLPFTQYYYAIYNDNVFAEGGDAEHYFKTFPTSTTSGHVRAWAIGDFGKGNTQEQQVRDSYPFDSISTDVWLWLGDNVYENGTEEEYVTKVFDSVYGYQKIMKHLPFEPCPGNHDYGVISPPQSTRPPLQHSGPYYDFVDVYQNGEAGGVATGHELFYSFDYRNVHFVSLNSEVGSPSSQPDNWTGVSLTGNNFTSSPMSDWLNQDLTANTKPWVVVYWHQTPYTDGSHHSSDFYEIYMKAMRENYCKIAEQYGVDVVLCGHSHVYERSYLVHGCYGPESNIGPANYVQQTSGNELLGEEYRKYTTGANPNYGTVYVNNGNSGSDYDTPDFGHPYMVAHYGGQSHVGSFVMDVDSNRLVGKHIDAQGVVRDEFTIVKTEAPTGIEKLNNAEVLTDVKVYPNPFSNSTTVSFEMKKTEKVSITVVDANGRTIKAFEGLLAQGGQKIEIDAAKFKLAKGVYNLSVTSGSQSVSRNLVIQ